MLKSALYHRRKWRLPRISDGRDSGITQLRVQVCTLGIFNVGLFKNVDILFIVCDFTYKYTNLTQGIPLKRRQACSLMYISLNYACTAY